MEIPIYLFTGFLESGKTKMIQETLQDEGFNSGERFLLIVCEEGIEEYDISLFAHPNVYIEYIDDSSLLSPLYLEKLRKKNNCERVIIEYNGMWYLNDLYENLPEDWLVYQEMMFADFNTFEIYNSNMRQLTVDKLQSCETIILNRSSRDADKMPVHKIVRAINKRCNIAYEYEDGEFEYDNIEDPLPFDINADIIDIKDDDFAIWYRDITDDPDKYNGKKVRFKGIVATSPKLGRKSFAIGRHIMVCCANDISYCALVCDYDGRPILNTKDWIILTASVIVGRSPVYNGKGPILKCISLSMTSQPENPVATFY